jgi:hypothetical protein
MNFQGLHRAVSDILPSAHHRSCVVHLEPKVAIKHGPSGKADLKELFWKAARTASRSFVDAIMSEMKTRDPDAHQHLCNETYVGAEHKEKQGVPLHAWTNAYGEGKNRGKIASSGTEARNAVNKKFRSKPPPLLCKVLIFYTEERVIKAGNYFVGDCAK